MIPLGLYLGNNGIEKALLVASVALLPMFEILNSAVEAVVDRFGEEQHETFRPRQGYGICRGSAGDHFNGHRLDPGVDVLGLPVCGLIG